MGTPTPRQQYILDLIIAHIVATGQPPTAREVALLAGINSPNGVVTTVRRLREQGVLEAGGEDGKARGIWPAGLRPVLQTAANQWWKEQK